MNYKKLEDLSCYEIGNNLSDYVWNIVLKWGYFAKDTIGKQLIRCVDSIAANIAEGFGRYHKKDKVKFYYNARGSVFEAQFWVKKAYKRSLMTKEENEYILKELRKLPRQINTLIKLTCENLKI